MLERAWPLSRHFLFRSDDLDYARSVLSSLYKSHGLAILDPNNRLDVRAHLVRLSDISFSYLNYGADVSMEPRRSECLETFTVIQIPLSGRATIVCGKEHLESCPDVASVITPTAPMRMRWRSDCHQITVRIDRAQLEQHCANLLGHPIGRPIEFALGMPLNSGGGRRWFGLVKAILDMFDEGTSLPEIAARELEHALMTSLLAEHPNNYQLELNTPPPAAAPRYVRRIEEFIEANADQALTAQAMARIAGVSVRSVYEGFRRHRGKTPLGYLKEVRLARAHEALRNADPATASVARIATEWGFTHLGRFSKEYRRRFGELPSKTLRR